MRLRACRHSMFILKRDIMHRSSKKILLVALFCMICATLSWAQTSAQQNQQDNQQQPVQDLTPPSDAEAERLAAPPVANTNQPGNTTTVSVPPSKKNPNEYKFIANVEE